MSGRLRKPTAGEIRIFCIRLMVYIVGLFVLALGVAVSVKSELGAAPVNCVPYALHLITGVNNGTMTICVFIGFIALQALILRRDFKIWYLLEIFCSVLFGWFVDFANFLLTALPAPQFYPLRLVFLGVSILLIAAGVFLYYSSGFIRLPGEGLIQAIADKSGLKFHNVKSLFDTSLTVISAALSLIFLHELLSVREGTVITAICVGFVVGWFTRWFGKPLNRLMGKA